MESLELRIFREVARESSISKAAEKMGYVQSNISNHIHRLEKELGTTLFLRHSKGVTLTASGEKLLTYANQVVLLLKRAEDQFATHKTCVKIGATQTIAAYRLPVWLSTFRKEYPGTDFSISTKLQPELIQDVADDVLDCAFVYAGWNHPQLVPAFSYSEKLVIIAPAHLKPHEIPFQPIIASDAPGCPLSDRLQSWVYGKTSRKSSIVRFDTVESILQAVSLGLGISALPVSVLSNASMERIQVVSSEEMDQVTIQVLVSKNAKNIGLTQFLNAVRSQHQTIDIPA